MPKKRATGRGGTLFAPVGAGLMDESQRWRNWAPYQPPTMAQATRPPARRVSLGQAAGIAGGYVPPWTGLTEPANVANLYLPVTQRTGAGTTYPVYPAMAPGQAGYQGAYNEPAYTMGNAPQAPQAPTAGGAGGQAGGGYRPPPGIDPAWYREFQQQHGGKAPEQFYGGHGEGLAEALADREWSQGFQQMTGHAPSQYDWENWYYQSRYGGRPGPPRGSREYEAMRAAEKYKSEKRTHKWRRKQRIAAGTEKPRKKGEPEQRPPLWVPPQVTWR
jgi:hypothetical protein